MIRMKHDKHGFCHAHDKNEEAYLRKLGWIEESEPFAGESAGESGGEVAEPIAPKRRGRPPKVQ